MFFLFTLDWINFIDASIYSRARVLFSLSCGIDALVELAIVNIGSHHMIHLHVIKL